MFGVLQDWIAIESFGGDQVAQSGSRWIPIEGIQNITFWLEVRLVEKPITLFYETALVVEPTLFRPMASLALAASATPIITRILVSQNPTLPACGLIRWRLTSSAAIDEIWRTTFRILYSAKAGKVNAGINPSSLPLTGWWSASYSGSPWLGSPSAGPSSGRNVAEGANPPSTGAALGIFTPADFDGVNDSLTSPLNTTNFFSGPAWTIVALINADTAVAPGAQPYQEPAILSDVAAGRIGLGFSTAGATAFHYNGSTWSKATAACATGAWHLVQARYNGTNIEVRVDGGAWTQTSAPNASVGAVALRLGVNWDVSKAFDGRVAEVMTANVALTNAECDQIRAYVNGRYGLGL